MTKTRTKETTCEACGGEFGCGAAEAACWCADIELSEAARSELRAKYAGCLCRPCLESYAARAAEAAGGASAVAPDEAAARTGSRAD